MTKKITHDEFCEKVKSIVKNEYTVIGIYNGTKNKVKIKHNCDKCNNYEWDVYPRNFLFKNSRCPKCNGNAKKTTEEFIMEVFDIVGEEYSVIGEYKSALTKIEMKHNICNKQYYVRPNDFITGYRCFNCYGNKRKTTNEYKEEVFELVGDEYEVLSEYTNNKNKIKMRHKCGYEFLMSPNSFLSGQRCCKCSGNFKKNTDFFKKEIYELELDDYTLLGDYTSTHNEILIRHNICNYEYHTSRNKFLKGRRCPKCNESKGEKAISKWLHSENIQFERQFTFEDLKGERNIKLRFDFGIYINGELILVEYDGIQHYEPKFGEEEFIRAKRNDKTKNQYCLDNNIKLIRIPYWEFENRNEDDFFKFLSCLTLRSIL